MSARRVAINTPQKNLHSGAKSGVLKITVAILKLPRRACPQKNYES